MKKAPDIIVQIIHIAGPLKGEVAEFALSEVTIGRHPSCQVTFPKDQAAISRYHAKIVRDGNRFKLIDQSANGTLVNGKFITEHYLKDGDVIFLTETGPKISFLTRKPDPGEVFDTRETPPPSPPVSPPPQEHHSSSSLQHGQPPPPPLPEVRQPEASQRRSEEVRPPRERERVVQEISVPLVIQYGPNLHSFKKLPVTFGKNPESDFVLQLPSILGRHGQFFFSDNEYWIKDLTGRDTIMVNGQPAGLQLKLNAEDRVRFGPDGPLFQFIGGGRLVELDEPPESLPLNGMAPDSTQGKEKSPPDAPKGKKRGLLQSLFKKG